MGVSYCTGHLYVAMIKHHSQKQLIKGSLFLFLFFLELWFQGEIKSILTGRLGNKLQIGLHEGERVYALNSTYRAGSANRE